MKAKFRTVSKAETADWLEWKRKVGSGAENATWLVLGQMGRAAADVAQAQFHGAGNLARSIQVRKNSRFSGEVGPTVVYGRIQELGGEIFPKGHPFLAFYWPAGPPGLRHLPDGRVLVRHVTLPARPYLKPGVEIVKPMIGQLVGAEIEKSLGL